MVWKALILILKTSLVVGCAASTQSQGSAFLVVDALAFPPDQRQPTYIALKRGHDEIHVPTGGALVELPAGRCSISHVDFGSDMSRSEGTAWIDEQNQQRLRFNLLPAAIGYLGMIRVQSDPPKVVVVGDAELFRRACNSNRSAFAKLPMYVLSTNDKLGYVDCEAEQLRTDQ
ncbi:MAG: hypothetical protein RIC56_08100 [Pseudomonadales bacterium]